MRKEEISMEPRVRVAIIGAGQWGLQHAKVFSEVRNVTLCAIVGRTLEKVQMRANLFNVPYYLDIREMIKREHPDLVSVCVPGDEMFCITKCLIEEEIPILIEKPVTYDLEQAEQLINMSTKRNLFCGVNFIHRYSKPVQMAYAAIQKKNLGNIVCFNWRMGQYGSCKKKRYGNLIETQCHGLDLIEFLCGSISTVFCEMTDSTNRGYTTLTASLKLKNGAVGSFLGTYDTIETYHPSQYLEICGRLGRIQIEDFVGKYSMQKFGSESEEIWTPGMMNEEDRFVVSSLRKHINEVVKNLIERKEPPISIEYGYRTLYLAHRMIESFEIGQRVNV